MQLSSITKWRLAGAFVAGAGLWASLSGAQWQPDASTVGTTVSSLTQVLSRPTDHSIGINVLAPTALEAYVEYGTAPGKYSGKTTVLKSAAKVPLQIEVGKLAANTAYFYRLRYREGGSGEYQASDEYRFHTARPPGSTFVFAIQADSHPERDGRMFTADLYARTMANVRQDNPDFFISLGDDFSIDRGMNWPLTAEKVNQVYINQRNYMGTAGASTPIFLVNGSHEQGQRHLLDGTPDNPAVWAGSARNRYFSQPAPDGFYTGDEERIDFIGLLRDYYAWTWGDALFIVIDPYWHSSIPIGPEFQADSGVKAAARATTQTGGQAGAQARGNAAQRDEAEGENGRDQWLITLGEAQYRWLQRTLQQSKAKYKFIFSHHVLGTGRGGVEMADLYEWGGRNAQGGWEFDKKRPGWELPIHQMMVKYNVSAFFQGHDHIFVRQAKDGVVYQEVPNPANPNNGKEQTDFRKFYTSGDYLGASGHLRVTVSPQNAKVDYVWSWLPQDDKPEHKHGAVAFSYDLKPH